MVCKLAGLRLHLPDDITESLCNIWIFLNAIKSDDMHNGFQCVPIRV